MNMFYDVISPHLKHPHDVARISNAMAVTRPAVAREVDLADYDGQSIAYDTLGVGDPVVRIHGTPFSSHVWRNIARELARDHKVYIVDLLAEFHHIRGATPIIPPAVWIVVVRVVGRATSPLFAKMDGRFLILMSVKNCVHYFFKHSDVALEGNLQFNRRVNLCAVGFEVSIVNPSDSFFARPSSFCPNGRDCSVTVIVTHNKRVDLYHGIEQSFRIVRPGINLQSPNRHQFA